MVSASRRRRAYSALLFLAAQAHTPSALTSAFNVLDAAREAQAALALRNCSGTSCMDRYIDAPDPAYGWSELVERRLKGTSRGVPWTGHVLRMTSQRWLREGDATPHVWVHPMLVVIPDAWGADAAEGKDWATYLVGGADHTRDEWASMSTELPDIKAVIELAVRTLAPAVLITSVPDQPATFATDWLPIPRMEDSIKAHTWRHYLDHTADFQWPIEVPNAKAAARGMDTTVAFFQGRGRDVKRFGVVGCSKRAVAAIQLCAHDARCELLVPCAMTAGMQEHQKRLIKALGASPMAEMNYGHEGIFLKAGTPEAERLYDIVDPAAYLRRLTMPKYWITFAQDDFFILDHTEMFWKDLPSPKRLLAFGNVGHIGSLSHETAPPMFGTIAAVIGATFTKKSLPMISWHFDEAANEMVVNLDEGPAPKAVTLWSSRTCPSIKRRDFRQRSLDSGAACQACGEVEFMMVVPVCNISRSTRWTSSSLETFGRSWRASVPVPEVGWSAFFVNYEFDSPLPEGEPVHMSTETVVLPYHKYPFPECHGVECDAGGRYT